MGMLHGMCRCPGSGAKLWNRAHLVGCACMYGCLHTSLSGCPPATVNSLPIVPVLLFPPSHAAPVRLPALFHAVCLARPCRGVQGGGQTPHPSPRAPLLHAHHTPHALAVFEPRFVIFEWDNLAGLRGLTANCSGMCSGMLARQDTRAKAGWAVSAGSFVRPDCAANRGLV